MEEIEGNSKIQGSSREAFSWQHFTRQQVWASFIWRLWIQCWSS